MDIRQTLTDGHISRQGMILKQYAQRKRINNVLQTVWVWIGHRVTRRRIQIKKFCNWMHWFLKTLYIYLTCSRNKVDDKMSWWQIYCRISVRRDSSAHSRKWFSLRPREKRIIIWLFQVISGRRLIYISLNKQSLIACAKARYFNTCLVTVNSVGAKRKLLF